jgi:hypothetical protein
MHAEILPEQPKLVPSGRSLRVNGATSQQDQHGARNIVPGARAVVGSSSSESGRGTVAMQPASEAPQSSATWKAAGQLVFVVNIAAF